MKILKNKWIFNGHLLWTIIEIFIIYMMIFKGYDSLLNRWILFILVVAKIIYIYLLEIKRRLDEDLKKLESLHDRMKKAADRS